MVADDMPREREVVGWRIKCESYEGTDRVDVQYFVGFEAETAEPEWTYNRLERNRDKPDTANSRVYDCRGDAFLARRRIALILASEGCSVVDKAGASPAPEYIVLRVTRLVEAVSADSRKH